VAQIEHNQQRIEHKQKCNLEQRAYLSLHGEKKPLPGLNIKAMRRSDSPSDSSCWIAETAEHLIDGISSVCRNGEIKTERQRVSRDLAVRHVVLPDCAKPLPRIEKARRVCKLNRRSKTWQLSSRRHYYTNRPTYHSFSWLIERYEEELLLRALGASDC
jgi:hypothetical protein